MKSNYYSHSDSEHPYAQSEEQKAKRRAVYHQNPDYFLKRCRKWREENPNYVKDYYSTHHKISVTNKNRTPKMWNAQVIAGQIPLLPFCELCPEDDARLAVIRHHPDYNYPLIFVSTCKSCHTYVHKDLMKQGISLQHMEELLN
jgi:hypothetical protein